MRRLTKPRRKPTLGSPAEFATEPEGRAILDRRDRNALTGAEFPVPALANPRVVRFTLPLLTGVEVRGEWRRMLAALGAAGEALWVPEVGLGQAELNA